MVLWHELGDVSQRYIYSPYVQQYLTIPHIQD